jgi:type I site-specific restriction endonuclease
MAATLAARGLAVTTEARARQLIDQRLRVAGWQVQDRKDLNLGAGRGVAVREYPTAVGPADYLLFVDRLPVGIVEATRDEVEGIEADLGVGQILCTGLEGLGEVHADVGDLLGGNRPSARRAA